MTDYWMSATEVVHITPHSHNHDDCRPVLVLDPDDAEQMEHLVNSFLEERDRSRDPYWADMAAAVRSLLPTRTPDEPTDLAARVRDKDGYEWVKAVTSGWWFPLASDRSGRPWSGLCEHHGPVEIITPERAKQPLSPVRVSK